MNALIPSRKTLDDIRTALRRFHDSERADIPVGTILLVAFIVVPLVLLLIVYRKEIVDYFRTEFNFLQDEGAKANRPTKQG